MPPLLFWFIVLMVLGWFWRRSQRRGTGTHASDAARRGPGQQSHAGGGRLALPEPMLRCAECGAYAPASESVKSGAQVFCSHDHARRYAARVGEPHA